MTLKQVIIKIAANKNILNTIKQEFGVDSPIMHKIRDILKNELKRITP